MTHILFIEYIINVSTFGRWNKVCAMTIAQVFCIKYSQYPFAVLLWTFTWHVIPFATFTG